MRVRTILIFAFSNDQTYLKEVLYRPNNLNKLPRGLQIFRGSKSLSRRVAYGTSVVLADSFTY